MFHPVFDVVAHKVPELPAGVGDPEPPSNSRKIRAPSTLEANHAVFPSRLGLVSHYILSKGGRNYHLADAVEASLTWCGNVLCVLWFAPADGARLWVLSQLRRGGQRCVGGLGRIEPYRRVHRHHFNNRLAQVGVALWKHTGEAEVVRWP